MAAKGEEQRMKILAVDDERIALESLMEAIKKAEPDAEIRGFRKAGEALEYAGQNPMEAAFLDIEMRGMNGMAFAKRLKEIQPDVNIIFVTGYSQYMGEAFKEHASGYVLKPVTEERIKDELQNLRHPVRRETPKQRMKVQCLGNFEVFVDGAPLKFRYSITKELLAYLVDRRGSLVNTREMCAVLWEDAPVTLSMKSQVRNCIADLKHVLTESGCEKMLVRSGRDLGVDVETFDCDMYRFLQMDVEAVNAYRGEYMSQYSWAEMTLGRLNKISENYE